MDIDNRLKPLIYERAQRGSFDSHDVVNDYRNNYPEEYGALLEKAERRAVQRAQQAQYLHIRKKPSAVHALHTGLGIRIARLCIASGLQRTPSRSRDVYGQQSRCLSWSAIPSC